MPSWDYDLRGQVDTEDYGDNTDKIMTHVDTVPEAHVLQEIGIVFESNKPVKLGPHTTCW